MSRVNELKKLIENFSKFKENINEYGYHSKDNHIKIKNAPPANLSDILSKYGYPATGYVLSDLYDFVEEIRNSPDHLEDKEDILASLRMAIRNIRQLFNKHHNPAHILDVILSNLSTASELLFTNTDEDHVYSISPITINNKQIDIEDNILSKLTDMFNEYAMAVKGIKKRPVKQVKTDLPF